MLGCAESLTYLAVGYIFGVSYDSSTLMPTEFKSLVVNVPDPSTGRLECLGVNNAGLDGILYF